MAAFNIKPSTALHQHRRLIREVVHAHKAANPRFFGSVLHGTDTPQSDLDLLVDALPGATLFDLGAIQIELEEALGVSVGVATPGDINKRYRHQILAEAQPV